MGISALSCAHIRHPPPPCLSPSLTAVARQKNTKSWRGARENLVLERGLQYTFPFSLCEHPDEVHSPGHDAQITAWLFTKDMESRF